MKPNRDEQVQLMLLDATYKSLKKHDEVLRTEMNKDQYTIQQLEQYQPQTIKAKQAKMSLVSSIKILGIDEDETNQSILSNVSEYIESKRQNINSKTTTPTDYRAQIIKDNYFDINDKYYGNNDVMGPEPMHGTHVSGIIAAQRNNNTGINGIADHVQIMMIRAVPDGDEYDKDIALAIEYAVNNGAKIINMSFGKSFSPEKNGWTKPCIMHNCTTYCSCTPPATKQTT